ncbi:hypothetical protein D3871_24750 [Noviherbaspirillum saxi]|uniref:Uncharacterized protein n=1 Tax=Noviherbaspirillum saxi TaxID=2320863 RepID=A0A3A3FEX2_9BURK|nr:hypothetical protein D3871_24750 [Noviherbaspirillum saxi]
MPADRPVWLFQRSRPDFQFELKRASMLTEQKPTKEQVRRYMEQRKAEHTPPPSLEEIRKRLDWIYQKDSK